MKRSLTFAFLIVMSSLSLHAAKNSQTVTLLTPVHVGAIVLPAGNCKVSWTGTGSDVQLTLDVKGQNPVTVPAHIVAQTSPGHNSVATTNVNGAEVLQAVGMEKLTLVLDGNKATGN
jgi:hypothetical protein